MKLLSLIILLLSIAWNATAQQNAASIKQQMAKIRQSTNWEDPVAAKKANEQIRELSKKLMMNAPAQENQPTSLSGNEAEKAKKESVDEKMQMWGQVMKSAANGKGADILLAEPIRDEIVEKFREDDDPSIKNADWFVQSSYLLINLSLPQVQTIINQMPAFKAIKTLIITCEKPVTTVNLDQILSNASTYPLEELYIINFGSSITALPSNIGNFKKLKVLSVFNNKVNKIPASVSSLSELQILEIDMNPVSSVLELIKPLKKLKELSLAKTAISVIEIDRIKNEFPNLKIMPE